MRSAAHDQPRPTAVGERAVSANACGSEGFVADHRMQWPSDVALLGVTFAIREDDLDPLARIRPFRCCCSYQKKGR
jgi:hypothetical protein